MYFCTQTHTYTLTVSLSHTGGSGNIKSERNRYGCLLLVLQQYISRTHSHTHTLTASLSHTGGSGNIKSERNLYGCLLLVPQHYISRGHAHTHTLAVSLSHTQVMATSSLSEIDMDESDSYSINVPPNTDTHTPAHCLSLTHTGGSGNIKSERNRYGCFLLVLQQCTSAHTVPTLRLLQSLALRRDRSGMCVWGKGGGRWLFVCVYTPVLLCLCLFPKS